MLDQSLIDGNFIELRARHRVHDTIQQQRYKQVARIKSWATSHSEKGWDVYFSCASRDADGNFASSSILWCDYDQPLPPGLCLPPPSFVVASGHGQHLYWSLVNPIRDPEYLRKLLRAIANQLDGDLACTDPTHFLRLPNTLNYKYDPPHPVTLTVERPDLVYTAMDIEKFIELPQEIVSSLYIKAPKGDRSDLDWETINNLIRFGLSDTAIFGIYKYMPIGGKARENVGYLTTTIINARQAQGQSPSPVETALAGDIITSGRIAELVRIDDQYFRVQGTDIKPVSTFVFDVIAVQESGQGDYLLVNVIVKGRPVKTNLALPMEAFGKAIMLNNAIRRMDATWLGSDHFTGKLKAFLADEWETMGSPRISITHQLGRVVTPTHDVYVTSRGIYDIAMEEVTDIVYVEPGYEHPEIVHDFSLRPLDAKTAQTVLEQISEVNTPQVMGPILGWFIASHFKPLFEAAQIRFPHLLVYGTRGAGKTTILTQIFQPLMGYLRPHTWQANSTRFVTLTLLGSTTSIPISLTEFRESSQRQKQSFFSLLRTAYDFGKDARGRQDLTTVQYDLSAPIVLDGEDSITDPALQERFVSVYLDVRDISTHRGTINKIRTSDLRRLGADIVRKSLTVDSAQILDMFLTASNVVRDSYTREIPERMLTNQAVAVTGLMFLQRLFPNSPFLTDPNAVRGYFEEEIDEIVNTNTGRTYLSADKLVEDVVNHVLGVTVQGRDDQGVNYRYKPEKDGNILCFHLSTAYAWWRKQQTSIREDVPTSAMIKKQLNEQKGGGYIVEHRTTTSQFGRNSSMYHIDLVRAAKSGLDIDLVE